MKFGLLIVRNHGNADGFASGWMHWRFQGPLGAQDANSATPGVATIGNEANGEHSRPASSGYWIRQCADHEARRHRLSDSGPPRLRGLILLPVFVLNALKLGEDLEISWTARGTLRPG